MLLAMVVYNTMITSMWASAWGGGLESAPSPLLLRKYACYCTETRLIWSVKCLPHCSGSHVPTMTTYRVKMASYISNIRIMDFTIFQNVRKSPKLI